jgi:hypothetical protein
METWQPGDEAELAAGWRLWLELSARGWPGQHWDGTPADAVRPLRELIGACEEVHAAYLAESRTPSARIVQLLQSVVMVASLPFGLWWEDSHELDAERAALLHSDLAGFVEHAAAIRALLAAGGGWAEFDADRSHRAS